MEFCTLKNIDINGGFWKKRQDLNAAVTVKAVYRQFEKTGRFAVVKKEFDKEKYETPHFFWDSDIAKWLESAAYVYEKSKDKELLDHINEIIDDIVNMQEESGYFNSWYQNFSDGKRRFTDRTDHELYCLGHLIEAAIACELYAGNGKLMAAMDKYVDYVIKLFMIDKSPSFVTPGHEEIELALGRLYLVKKDRRYLELMRFFLDNRGLHGEKSYDWANEYYAQDFLPVRSQRTAEGHAVRAGYLYYAMALLAGIDGDQELKEACEGIFNDIITNKMYISGGIGSGAGGEAFTINYDLPNLTAYSESCAIISLAFFSKAMLELDMNSKYSDIMEKIFYNGFLSSVSLDGKSFFYENPLEIQPKLVKRDRSVTEGRRLPITKRLEIFGCSCCPPNITRLMATLGEYIYSSDEDTVYIHNYITSNSADLEIRTNYPLESNVTIKCKNGKRLAVRIPGWCDQYSIKADGSDAKFSVIKGYAYIDGNVSKLEIDFEMPVKFVRSNPMLSENAGRVAVTRGPVVFCLEGNYSAPVKSICLSKDLQPEVVTGDKSGLFSLKVNALIPKVGPELYSDQEIEFTKERILLVPYFSFANDPQEEEMSIWLLSE